MRSQTAKGRIQKNMLSYLVHWSLQEISQKKTEKRRREGRTTNEEAPVEIALGSRGTMRYGNKKGPILGARKQKCKGVKKGVVAFDCMSGGEEGGEEEWTKKGSSKKWHETLLGLF